MNFSCVFLVSFFRFQMRFDIPDIVRRRYSQAEQYGPVLLLARSYRCYILRSSIRK